MRIVAALGGNALLERGERPDSGIQQAHVESAVAALAPLARDHELIITHGNGPQVGLLAMESARDPALSRPYPFDVLGAQTQGMIGYWLVQALQNALPGRLAGCLVCRTLVSADDPAFADPAKFVGPVYDEARARQLAADYGWQIRRDGTAWRRVVPSPEPVRLLDLPLISELLSAGAIVVCAGGGGVPVTQDADGAMPRRRGRRRQGPDRGAACPLGARRGAAAAHRRRVRAREFWNGTSPADPARDARRAAGAAVPARLDGPEGGCRLPFRRVHRRDGGHRAAGRRRGAARTARQGRSSPASRPVPFPNPMNVTSIGTQTHERHIHRVAGRAKERAGSGGSG